jgi:type IV pilus assembly protein PilM
MSFANKFMDLLRDPPPEFAFEISADSIAMSRTRPPAAIQHAPLKPGVIVPSPVKENILDAAAFANTIRQLTPPSTGRGKRGVALILPDNCVRIAVLDFDTLPEKEEELRPLINFRLKKSVPFDIDEAALSYFAQGGSVTSKKVVVAVAPSEIVAHYEAPFRAAGLQPGFVTVSSLAGIDLLPVAGSIMLARRSPGALTVLALANGAVNIARTLEIGEVETADHHLEEAVAALYPTLAWIEDQTGGRPEKLFLAGFGDDAESSSVRLSVELEIEVEVLAHPFPGLAGYLASLAPKSVARKAAA